MDLIVDASLDDTNRDLKAIHDEFSNAQDSANENAGIWGQADLASAMEQFAHDWYVHRDAINNRLGTLSDRVDKACSAWSDADKQLAASLETVDGSTGA
jgi:hypothetical protein